MAPLTTYGLLETPMCKPTTKSCILLGRTHHSVELPCLMSRPSLLIRHVDCTGLQCTALPSFARSTIAHSFCFVGDDHVSSQSDGSPVLATYIILTSHPLPPYFPSSIRNLFNNKPVKPTVNCVPVCATTFLLLLNRVLLFVFRLILLFVSACSSGKVRTTIPPNFVLPLNVY